MKNLLSLISFLLLGLNITAQKAKKTTELPPKSPLNAELNIPLSPESWDFKPGGVEFSEYKGVPTIKIQTNDGYALLKDFIFFDGVIEFDLEPQDAGFGSFYFRSENEQETELVYLRGRAGNPLAMDAIQYAPMVKGINLWDVLPHYQGPANIKKGEWNHFKLVVSGKQMLVFMNDSNPTLVVPRLEGNSTQGGLGFGGKVYISNLVIRPNETEGLSPKEGWDPTYNDSRYIRNWKMSQPSSLAKGRELFAEELPAKETEWQNITAERRGLINLTRIYGRSESRRVVWLKVNLKTIVEQKRKIDLGFSDEVWVFLNGRMTYVDKNLYLQGMRKKPDGRISTENCSFELNLKVGDNELLIGIANDFYGWGIIARMDTLEGITTE